VSKDEENILEMAFADVQTYERVSDILFLLARNEQPKLTMHAALIT
jgi:hypothetical protein